MFRFTLMSKKNNIAYCENKVSLLAFLTANLQKYIKIKNLAKEFFEEKLNSKDLKYFEKNVEVVFKKEGNEWKFDEGNSKNKDFLDGLTLGFASILEKINKDNKNDGK